MELIKGPDRRVHVLKAQDWNRAAGTDFWLLGGPVHAGAAGNDLITDFGWTETSLTNTIAGIAGDLLLSTDVGTPYLIGTDAGNDLLLSPAIFGDYSHGLVAKQFLGYTPTQLCLEVYGQFGTLTASETTSGFGFSSGSGLTATNHIAYIHSLGTGSTFAIRGTDGTGALTDAGATVASVGTTPHLWKVILTQNGTAAGACEWFIDGVSQGVFTLVQDLFPTAFSMSASTTNRPAIAWAHVWYQ